MLVKSKTTGEHFTACLLTGDAAKLPRWTLTHAWNPAWHGSYLVRDQEGERSMATPLQFNAAYEQVQYPADAGNCLSLASRLVSYAVRLASAPTIEPKIFLIAQMLESTEALANEMGVALENLDEIEKGVAPNAAILFLATAIAEDVSTEPVDAPPLLLSLYAHLLHAAKGANNG